MKIIKSLLCGLPLLIAVQAHAELIDLNNQDSEQCLKQLVDSKDIHPFVMEYTTSCEFCMALLPVYKAFAGAHPDRDFFLFDVDNDSPAVEKNCMHHGDAFYPRIDIVESYIDSKTQQKP